MGFIAGAVDRVSASHEDYGLRIVEHVERADGTIAVGGALDVFVGLGHFHVHAEAALLCVAMKLATILSQNIVGVWIESRN